CHLQQSKPESGRKEFHERGRRIQGALDLAFGRQNARWRQSVVFGRTQRVEKIRDNESTAIHGGADNWWAKFLVLIRHAISDRLSRAKPLAFRGRRDFSGENHSSDHFVETPAYVARRSSPLQTTSQATPTATAVPEQTYINPRYARALPTAKRAAKSPTIDENSSIATTVPAPNAVK